MRVSPGRSSPGSSTVSFRQLGCCTHCPVTASTPEPEGGARCVSSARRDLCGGRGAILVPTATLNPVAHDQMFAALRSTVDRYSTDKIVKDERYTSHVVVVSVR